MKQQSIKFKLGLMSGILLALLVVVGGIGYVGSSGTEEKLNEMGDVYMPAVENTALIDMMHDGLRAVAFRALHVADNPSSKERREIAEEFQELSTNMIKYLKVMEALEIPEDAKKSLDDAKPAIESYAKSTEEIVNLAMAGQRNEAIAKLPEFQRAYGLLDMKLSATSEIIAKDAHEAKVSGDKVAYTSRLWSSIVVVVGFAMGLFIAIGMINSLMKTLGSVINRLSSSSRELDSTSRQSSDTARSLSDSSLVQASSLQETVASAEQISAMVDQNAESASKAKNVVDQNTVATEAGSKSVTDMLAAISEIKGTNDEILSQMITSNKEFGNIVKIISEIGEKTKVINDIVFQTKLLSFNASVEAARAGEHGKGFAVVAEEVGNLAQMSGNAAKEITDMLDNSVRKVNEIVENTTRKVDQLVEVGKDKISMGQATAQKCRESLNKIADNAHVVAQIVTEIASASKEQAQGVQEINKAIAQLDQIMQQNTAVAQQSASQSHQLNAESENLAGTVSELLTYVTGGDTESLHKEARNDSGRRTKTEGIVEKHVTEDTKKVVQISSHQKQGSGKRHVSKQEKYLANRVSKKAVGSNEVPASNDPDFEEF